MATLNIQVDLHAVTCNKGHLYAVPYWVPSENYMCPMCAAGRMVEKDAHINDRDVQLKHKDSQIHSLRGVVTKLKRKGAKEK